jgi:N-formylglutamate amidohydrolase
MKAKEKTQQPEKSIFTEMKQSDMTAIDRKIHDLLIAEGYRAAGTQRFEGTKLNNHTNVNRMEYRRGERERVFVITHEPGQKETA